MRRLISGLKTVTAVLTAVLFLTQNTYAADKTIRVNINNNELNSEYAPYIYEGNVMINLKSILTAFGSEFSWDEEERTVKAVKNGNSMTIRIGSNEALINGKPWTMDSKACITSESTYVPLSFFKKAYEIDTEIDVKTNTVNFSVYSDASGKLYPYRPVLFFGDSITEGLGAEDNPNVRPRLNRGINGNKTSDMLQRLPEALSVKPGKLFLMAGINDICSGKDLKTTTENYLRMLDIIKTSVPDCEVYIESVLPVGEVMTQKIGNIANEKVNELNRSLIKIAQERKHTYIDLAALYKDRNGRLDAKYTQDGTHLLQEAYGPWKEAIKKYLE